MGRETGYIREKEGIKPLKHGKSSNHREIPELYDIAYETYFLADLYKREILTPKEKEVLACIRPEDIDVITKW